MSRAGGVVNWDEAPITSSLRSGTVRRVVSGQHSTLLRVRTEAGAPFDGRPHRHVNEQWLVVLAGTLRVVCDDVESELTQGDVAFFPANAWHAAIGVGPEGSTYLELSAPPRLDLLPGSLAPSPMVFAPLTERPA